VVKKYKQKNKTKWKGIEHEKNMQKLVDRIVVSNRNEQRMGTDGAAGLD
jgi:hypothetical protein